MLGGLERDGSGTCEHGEPRGECKVNPQHSRLSLVSFNLHHAVRAGLSFGCNIQSQPACEIWHPFLCGLQICGAGSGIGSDQSDQHAMFRSAVDRIFKDRDKLDRNAFQKAFSQFNTLLPDGAIPSSELNLSK